MADQGKSLEERIEFPSIPKEAAKKIARLEEEFTRTEVDQCLFPFLSTQYQSLIELN